MRAFFQRAYRTCLHHHPHLLLGNEDIHLGAGRTVVGGDGVVVFGGSVGAGAVGDTSFVRSGSIIGAGAGGRGLPSSVSNLNKNGTIEWVARLLKYAAGDASALE
jgi:hypothetical protein